MKVCLTFDDGHEEHHGVVLPMLRERRQRATFYVSVEGELASRQLHDLYDAGMEVGNHGQHIRDNAQFQRGIEQLADHCIAAGVPKPVTFAYPGFVVTEQRVAIVREYGFLAARVGIPGWSREAPLLGKPFYPGKDDLSRVQCAGNIINEGFPLETFADLVRSSGNDGVAVFCFHEITDTATRLRMISPSFLEQCLDWLAENDVETVTMRDLVRLSLRDPWREHPHRSPVAVAAAVEPWIRDRHVCDLGCAEGDNMVFMSRFARRVSGIDRSDRLLVAERRGLDVRRLDYRESPIPSAEVYYYWPTDARDTPYLTEKILSDRNFSGTLILGGRPGAEIQTEFPTTRLEVETPERPPKDKKLREIFSGPFLVTVIEVRR